MRARSSIPSLASARPGRELKDRLGSRYLLPLTGLERRSSELGSELHPKQQKQIQPQHTHEMPVTRSGVQGASSQDGLVQFRDDADETAEPPENVQGMSHGQHVEEGVADVRGESESPWR